MRPESQGDIRRLASPLGPKVFCVGLQKTGTTSIRRALSELGFRVAEPFTLPDPDASARVFGSEAESLADARAILLARAVEIADERDAAVDNPWPLIYRDLDLRFPGSRFILTVRDPQRWFESAVRHFGDSSTRLRSWIYGPGAPEGNRDAYIEGFRRHNRRVREYFAGRDEALLEMDLEAGDGWERLCAFLDRPRPEGPFPHVNRGVDRTAGASCP